MTKRTCVAAILISCAVFCFVACHSKKELSSAAPAPAPQATGQVAPPQLTPLDQLLAPVALYPDALLAQVLTSATSPQQVTSMDNWLRQNSRLHGSDAQKAADKQGFDASFVALVLFPAVLNMMASHIDWTTELGTAFLSDEKGVMESVERLRAQALAVGTLKSTPQQGVRTETLEGQTVIVVQPANPQVIYVPQYDSQAVYSPPPAAAAATSSSSDSDKIAAGLIGFCPGIAIGAPTNNDSYYAPYGWGAWGMHWNTNSVYVAGARWGVPPGARYPYVRPVPVPDGGYRPVGAVYAPTNINVDTTRGAASRAATSLTPRPTMTPTPRPGAGSPPKAPQGIADYGSRGYNASGSQAPSSDRISERASADSSAFTGYESGNAERAASERGRSSVSHSTARVFASRR